jgi:hypothetical protein
VIAQPPGFADASFRVGFKAQRLGSCAGQALGQKQCRYILEGSGQTRLGEEPLQDVVRLESELLARGSVVESLLGSELW